jgi:dCMP deaminase
MSLKPSKTMSWDQYFMTMAVLVSYKSKDPNTKVGSIVCDGLNRVIGCGFNGPPIHIPDDQIPWEREGDTLNTKYIWLCHAEANTLDFSDSARLKGAKLYTTLYPCAECCKRIIQSQLAEVVYLDDKYHDSDSCQASRQMFEWAGIKVRQFTPELNEVVIRIGDASGS